MQLQRCQRARGQGQQRVQCRPGIRGGRRQGRAASGSLPISRTRPWRCRPGPRAPLPQRAALPMSLSATRARPRWPRFPQLALAIHKLDDGHRCRVPNATPCAYDTCVAPFPFSVPLRQHRAQLVLLFLGANDATELLFRLLRPLQPKQWLLLRSRGCNHPGLHDVAHGCGPCQGTKHL